MGKWRRGWHNLGRRLTPLLFIAFILVIWEVLVRINDVPAYLLPAPSRIFLTLIKNIGELLDHSRTSLLETLAGLGIALILGIGLAVLMDIHPLIRQALYPLLVVSQSVPAIVLAPIFLVYFGFGWTPKILTVVLMCFFPIVVNIADGMAEVSPGQIHLLKSFGAKPHQIYVHGKIPAALPTLFSGLRVAATYGLSGAIVGEWLSSSHGLGYYLLRVKNANRMDLVFATVLVLILWSLALNGLVVLIERLLLRRPYRERGTATAKKGTP